MMRNQTDARAYLVSGETEDGTVFDGSISFRQGTSVDAEPDQIWLKITAPEGAYELLIERRGGSFVRVLNRDGIETIDATSDSAYALLPPGMIDADWLRRGPFFADRLKPKSLRP